jgi:hypothetical protein
MILELEQEVVGLAHCGNGNKGSLPWLLLVSALKAHGFVWNVAYLGLEWRGELPDSGETFEKAWWRDRD